MATTCRVNLLTLNNKENVPGTFVPILRVDVAGLRRKRVTFCPSKAYKTMKWLSISDIVYWWLVVSMGHLR